MTSASKLASSPPGQRLAVRRRLQLAAVLVATFWEVSQAQSVAPGAETPTDWASPNLIELIPPTETPAASPGLGPGRSDPPAIPPTAKAAPTNAPDAPPPPSPTNQVAAKRHVPREGELGAANSALAASRELAQSPNLTSGPPKAGAADVEKNFQAQLERGRKLRADNHFPEANTNFIAVLLSSASEDLKRTALLELALTAQAAGDPVRAQQVFAQYIHRWPEDLNVPEVLLRQGLLYRQMGANTLALSKFYAVMTTALNLKVDRLHEYQRLVLQAQSEIAETYYLAGKYADAADFFGRLLKLDTRELNKSTIQFKLVHCLINSGAYGEAASQAGDFVRRFPEAREQPEVRFLLVTALKQLGHNSDALEQVRLLLASQQPAAQLDPAQWRYWQQRTGNEIANQLYKESDYISALSVYLALADLENSASWQLPVWYQIGLVYERLHQPEKAAQTYARIAGRSPELGTNASPTLVALVDMATWRQRFLGWQVEAEQRTRDLKTAAGAPPEQGGTR